jgi:hypothetical protein
VNLRVCQMTRSTQGWVIAPSAGSAPGRERPEIRGLA